MTGRRRAGEAARRGNDGRSTDAGERAPARADGGRTQPADLARDRSDGETERLGGSRRSPRAAFDLEELRRRNPSTLAIDVLYLFASAFFATLALRGVWPAAIAAVPLATLLYFAWRSSPAFLAGQVVAVVASVVATRAGLVPL